MAGIYIHIPFCQKACIYCDFHFSTVLKHKASLVKGIIKEISQRGNYLEGKEVNTIYFGGGTPTLLNKEEFGSFFKIIYNTFNVNLNAEITIEANPDDISISKVKELKALGVNRLSIGVQSFFEEHLQFFNRSHNSRQATEAIKIGQDGGIDNITIDLIYGFHQLSKKQLEENLNIVSELGIPHVSAYALTVEPKTALAHLIKKKAYKNLDDALANEHFEIISNYLVKKGFEHYEVSNFGKSNFLSKHNSNYWKSVSYLGIGPSAHSFNGKTRSWNVANNIAYQKAIEEGTDFYEMEKLTPKDRLNEMLLTGLRTKWGIEKKAIQKYPSSLQKSLHTELSPMLSKGIIEEHETNFVLNKYYWFKADGIASELFQV